MEEWIVIILAVISMIAGSKGNKKRAAEPTEESLEGGFEELLRELGADQPEQKRVEVEPTPKPVPTHTPKPMSTATTQPKPRAQRQMTTDYKPAAIPPEGKAYNYSNGSTSRSKRATASRSTTKAKTKPIAPPEEPITNNEAQFEDINLRDMVIYDAILNPKHTEY